MLQARDTLPVEWLTRRQAAQVLNLSETLLRQMYAEDRGPPVCKLGTARSARVRYPRAALVQWAQDPNAFDGPSRPAGLPRFKTPRRRSRRAAE